jgi:AraC family transcriptional regulator
MLRTIDGSEPVTNSKPIRTTDYSVEVQHSGPATLPPVYHNLHLVTVVLSGEAVVIRGDAREACAARLVAGDGILRPAGQGRRVCWPEGIHCLHVHLHPRLVRRMCGCPTVTLQMRSRTRDPIILDIGFQLYRLVRSARPLDLRAAEDLVIALARHVATAYPAPDAEPIQVGRRSLEEVLDLFREEASTSYSLDTVAGWCGLSRPHFSRRIRALTGLWPQTMILGSRIEAAKHLLERNETSLSQVAYAAGFADQSHLTRVVRRSTGLTPSRYRASQEFKTAGGSPVG